MQTIEPIKPYPRPRRRSASIDFGPPPSPRELTTRRLPRPIDDILPQRPTPPRVPQTPMTPKPPVPIERTAVAHHVPPPSFTEVTLATPSQAKVNSPPAKIRHKKKIKSIMIIAIIIIAGTVAALVTQLPLALWLIVLYGITTLVMQIPSRTTFLIALIVLATVPASLVIIGENNIISSALASYAFLIMVVGVISLGRELLWTSNN